jgi:citrate lyase subunit beta/citryl-CoA lyase
MKRWRSLLFVPADDEVRLAKCHERQADAIILDLEDGVSGKAKPAAREGLPKLIGVLAGRQVELILRINTAWRDITADLDAGIHAGLSAIMVPKVEDAHRLRIVAEMIGEWETVRGIAPGSIGIIALVETALGLSCLHEIASAPRMIGIALGTEDMSLSLGVAPSATALDLPCRMVALAANTKSLMAFAIPHSIAHFRDAEAARAAAHISREFGGTGALCIHPLQVPVANQVFAPTERELTDAQATLDAWAQALSDGLAVASLNGRMIDKPVVERAKLVLSQGSRTQ